METIFSKIIKGKLPCFKVAESKDFLAFLDINPNSVGHTLCIPKKPEDKIFDLSEEQYIKLMSFSRKVALAIEKTIDCKRVGIAVIGLEVAHVHVHLIPINSLIDMSFTNKVKVENPKMEELANQIAINFN
jgi:histidine triad (HIT) family protein